MFARALALLGLALALSGCARDLRPETARGARPPRAGSRGVRSLSIPDGEACLERLSRRDIAFHAIAAKPGMVTPVAITGPIGGVRYESAGKTSLVCDCRLAVALDVIAPELRAFGVREVGHSGAYVYRTTRRGRPSLHARGLAIDVHRLRVHGRKLEVERDYVRGAGASCRPDSPFINRLACELDRTGLFEQVLTPDDDSDHRDHVHLAIRPL